jgi:hypothetical protein
MVEDQRNIASFTLRFTQHLWEDPQGEPHVQWRGQIRHVQGDEQLTFTELTDALQFIQRHLTQLTLDATAGDNKMDQDKVLHESFKLWEQFASTYSNIMFDAMERTIKQSEALKEQMDEAVGQALKTWQVPTSSTKEQDKILEAIDELNAQVKALTKKVTTLEKSLKED